MACLEALLLGGCQDLADIALEFGVAQIPELDRHQVAVHPEHGRYADGQVDVGAALREAELQEGIDAGHGFCSVRPQAARSSASRSSSMELKRFSLSTSMALRTTAARAGGMAGFSSSHNFALPCTCWYMTDMWSPLV